MDFASMSLVSVGSSDDLFTNSSVQSSSLDDFNCDLDLFECNIPSVHQGTCLIAFDTPYI